MSRRPPRIMLTAGEPSGDRLGAGLAEALRRQRPDVELFGMGGERMETAGVRLIQDLAEVSVVGIVEVLSRLPQLRRAMERLRGALVAEAPDLLVPIDFPDFNLRLAESARAASVPVVYFVSPQVWAWRRGRVRRIRGLVRHMMVLFRFETAFYADAGVPVTFVGHPLAEEPPAPREPADLKRLAGLDPGRTALALMPGSRAGEVSRLLPVMLRSAARLSARRPGLEWLVPLAPGIRDELVVELVRRERLPDVHLHRGDFPEVLRACDAGIVAAGTASLEVAAVGLPMVVIYRMNPISAAIGRALLRVDHVALPNLVAGRTVVPELLQEECRPQRIAAAVGRYLDDPEESARVRRGLADVRRQLGEPGVYHRAASTVLAELDRVRPA